jgi:PAS domain S-box-containing protein
MRWAGRSLRVLLVEDSEDDAQLLMRELRSGGYEPTYERVQTCEEMEKALAEAGEIGRPWQVVISEYQMPLFGAPDALALLRGHGYDTPFFVVASGKVEEDLAVAMMRTGAQDCVAKENLARLCPAIERELGGVVARREELRDSRDQLEIILRGVADGITAQDPSGCLIYANEAAAKIIGCPTAEALLETPVREAMRNFEVVDENGRPLPLGELPGRRALRGEKAEALVRFREVPTGEERWSVVSATPVFDERGRVRFSVNIFRDMTEQIRAEEALREAREAERNRIARDLHDDILQDIVYALHEVQILQVISDEGGAPALEEAAEALQRSVEGLRGAIFELRLRETPGRSFISALEALLDRNRRMARKSHELVLVVEDGFPREFSDRASRELLRIVREALANVRRHAQARHVRVRLWRDGDLVCLEVTDDGRGFDVENPGVGVGQQSMRHRALEIGGKLEVESEPGRGTRVRFDGPISRLVEGAKDLPK